MKSCVSLLTVSVYFLNACTTNPPSQVDIAGGSEVIDENDPVLKSTVALINGETQETFCTGTLIGSNHIVTAAHCLTTLAPHEILIGFGQKPDVANASPVVDALHNPNMTSDLSKDIGVILISSSNLPENAKPVRLAASDLPSKDLPVILAGYGETVRKSGDFGVLRRGETIVTGFDAARREFEIKENTGIGTCTGDSGGPAYVEKDGNLFLLGATSRGSSLDCSTGNGIFTDVRHYQGWMRCVFDHLEYPLGYLEDDDSQGDC